MERLGPYAILGTLGEGGMGTVYRARHPSGVERALKVLLGTSWDATRLGRFEREVQSLARLSHPNVVRIHDAGSVEGRPYFTMDLVDGQPLRARVKLGPLELDRALDVVCQVARGVGAMHAAGMVHRDLKPDNVMLGAFGEVLVMDWGIARAQRKGSVEGRLSMAQGEVAGTPKLMGQSSAHLSFALRQAHGAIRVVGFRRASLYDLAASGRPLDLAVTPMVNDWRGVRTP